jgi:saccharopine dehydrogenase-like NADP-dependent oxidoreductase
MLSEVPVKTAEGVIEVVPLKVLKAVLPDPASLAPGYTGTPASETWSKGKGGETQRNVYLQHLRSRGLLQRGRVPSHFLYTAGVPPVAAAILVAKGVWNPKTMVNVEELNPDPFIGFWTKWGFPPKSKIGHRKKK